MIQMAIPFTKNKLADLLFQCLSLSSPLGRLLVCFLGLGLLILVDFRSLGLPNLCLWKKIFGYCPADGTTRALNAFLHGNWQEAIKYNLNIFIIIPLVSVLLFSDILRFFKRKMKKKN